MRSIDPVYAEKRAATFERHNKNPETVRKRKEYYAKNRERLRPILDELARKWRLENRRRYIRGTMERNARRRMLEAKAMPSWVDKTELKRIYDNRPEGYHVDHIVPIKGKDVCGLHVPWNLQYLPAIENIRKNNKFQGVTQGDSPFSRPFEAASDAAPQHDTTRASCHLAIEAAARPGHKA